jgi:hypothetical protein
MGTCLALEFVDEYYFSVRDCEFLKAFVNEVSLLEATLETVHALCPFSILHALRKTYNH